MEIGAYSHKGKVREINEDAYYISKGDLNLFIVADGMGGHNAGEVASNIAINSIKEFMEIHIDQFLDKDEEKVCEFLKKATFEANKNIFKKAISEKECQGMGTTLTVVLILSKVYIAHVGDSRAYLIHNNNISQITQDHSLVAELLRNGSITENEAKIHPQRNMITRALGTEENIIIDIYTLDFNSDDIIFLCTDGLSNLIETDEIKRTLIDCDNMQHACVHLVELANERGGYDNITVIAIKNRYKEESR
ncbi:Stp1/IreP family PP2C-type Ser/Thr phosphatase [Crassaminicella thermophila]|uniref:Stp1/IreP family PP2C-type Ser/Thr phosphatase n=1 Tax=Crassaminicella thermophila TaxID=2599308 RepID=A0A5C0SD04_CRATE|nr:Stp1/IreP family PP2C-type Ser/Thr phosphatase [Crassaminicella thermophila]QEK12000.1 Stp1/IreP family PP2C-type Ser/Thr phosphatase [Crassaminicella thermophila]